ncbi:hypothetical protein [Actinacidiphila oryziradicis]|uniref:Uncharacterized protein n=1 Tax=Actinacidiphila oryziradicis TaxID=2571141 RepID=A0A4U0SNZ1_9ACTN|nr:hypothetical protein [Actinacidiphila oryziradicis]TKA11744.1 hypothetical protein FCI23_10465 [Actinacidiphila oryziradicis]
MPAETLTARGLQAAVALTTARNAGLEIPQAQLLGDTPAEEALLALTVLASCFLDFGAPSIPGAALRSAGRIAGRLEASEVGDK